jgi:hypothetical protein
MPKSNKIKITRADGSVRVVGSNLKPIKRRQRKRKRQWHPAAAEDIYGAFDRAIERKGYDG